MVVSRCCKSKVYIMHDYYVCEECNVWCDTIAINTIIQDIKDVAFFNES
jgi:hypothetical protein